MLGPRLDPELIAEMIGQRVAALLPVWEEALSTGVLSSTGGEITFAEESQRQVVVEAIPTSIRRALVNQYDWLVVERSSAGPGVDDEPEDGTPTEARPGRLTAREQTVMELLGRGRSNKQIARTLGISDHAVKRHVSNLLMKFNCSNRTEIALEWLDRSGAARRPA
jgi:DNA-binding NarL/FixJ family response regulator